jgi:hypothetical protein
MMNMKNLKVLAIPSFNPGNVFIARIYDGGVTAANGMLSEGDQVRKEEFFVTEKEIACIPSVL